MSERIRYSHAPDNAGIAPLPPMAFLGDFQLFRRLKTINMSHWNAEQTSLADGGSLGSNSTWRDGLGRRELTADRAFVRHLLPLMLVLVFHIFL